VILAHIGGVPVEEAVVSLAGGTGTGLLMARAWFASLRRRARRSDDLSGPVR
jgi:hypothetical protein